MIGLISPDEPVAQPPPFPMSVTGETRFPGHLPDRELIEVGLAANGTPTTVTVTQRLALARKGDYSFLIPAPATNVTAPPGSEAQPGLREAGIVWQGFSPGRRTLAAIVTLRPSEAAPALPLRITISRNKSRTVITLTNRTSRQRRIQTGTVDIKQLLRTLAQIKRYEVRPDLLFTPWTIPVTNPSATSVVVAAPMRITGTIGLLGVSPIRIRGVLGNGNPVSRTFTLRGETAPTIMIEAVPLGALEILPSARQLKESRAPIIALDRALGNAALARQYRGFLGTPDALAPSLTTYRYQTIHERTVLPTRQPARSHNAPHRSSLIRILLIAAAATGALGAAVVAWAHL